MLPSKSKNKAATKPTSGINLTPAQKASIASLLRQSGVPISDGIPASLRKRATTSGTRAGAVGLGSRSPLTKVAGRIPNKEQIDATGRAFTGYDSSNSGLKNAALVAASLLPIPGLKGVGAVARAGAKTASAAGKASKVATGASRVNKPAAKLSKAEARDVELREIKRLMQPEPRPAREVTRFSVDDDIRRAMRGKSGKVMSTGPKPVRSAFKSDSAFKTAMKGWEKTLEANRSAVRSGPRG